jgi:hypothetical protein
MRHLDLEKLIDALNAGQVSNWVFWHALSATVDFARVWIVDPDSEIPSTPYPFYFIKENGGLYVGAVLDMFYDLHAFVKPGHRKRGHLYNAVNDTIFPYFFQQGRVVQTVSFENPEVADSFTRRLGLKPTASWFSCHAVVHAEKDLSVYAAVPKIEPLPMGPSRDEASGYAVFMI